MQTPELFKSKKFQSAFLASVFAFAGFYLGFSVEQVMLIAGPLGVAYPIGQGMADRGKEAAKIQNGYSE